MKTRKTTRVFAFLLSCLLALSAFPFITMADGNIESYAEGDYTPFLIESVDGQAVYNEQTADMCYDFYLAAHAYILAQEEGSIDENAAFSFTTNNTAYTLDSVNWYGAGEFPSCGMLTGILNYKVGDQVKHTVLVAFRGTTIYDDWLDLKSFFMMKSSTPLNLDNIAEILTDIACIPGEDGYHTGFAGAAEKHYDRMKKSVSFNLGNGRSISFSEYLERMSSKDSDYNMIVTGHSLGGGVAGIFTSKYLDDLNHITSANAVAYTFASPLTCSKTQAQKDSAIVKNLFNFVNTSDWVPKVGADITDGSRTGIDLVWTKGDKSNIGDWGAVLFSKSYHHTFKDYAPFIKELGRLLFDLKDIKSYKDLTAFFVLFTNHHMSVYKEIKNHVNDNVPDYVDSVVLYNHYDAGKKAYQRIVYSNGQLVVSGNDVLRGDWSSNTTIAWNTVISSATSLVFDDECNIGEIGDHAFAGFSGLSCSLNLPASVRTIGDYAFFHCGFIGKLIIPAQTESVGQYAFYGCSSLSQINGSEAKKMTWGYGAFANCVGEHDLILPNKDTGTDLPKVFGKYYVQDKTGVYLVDVAAKNIILPGDVLYLGRLSDELLTERPYYDFHYLLTTGNTDTADNIKAKATASIPGVAFVDETGCIRIDPACKEGTEFTAVIMDNFKGEPDYKVYDSSRFVHFTVRKANDIFAGGIGTNARPFLIQNSDQFTHIKDDLSACYRLISNVDFNKSALSPLGVFKGELDGNGYSVYGFTISVNKNAGLFTKIAEGACVRNITVGDVNSNVSVKAGNTENTYLVVGGICASNQGTISNCCVEYTEISSDRDVNLKDGSLINRIGGISGENYGTISNCVVKYSNIHSDCKSHKDVHPTWCYVYAGGLVGFNQGSVYDCSSINNTIKGYTYSIDEKIPFTDWHEGQAQTYCGGLAAYSSKNISNCNIYNNSITATADGDGGKEGTDIEKKDKFCADMESSVKCEGCTDRNKEQNLPIASIRINTTPSKSLYYIGESANYYGLIIEDNYKHNVSGPFKINGLDLNKSSTQTVTVTYPTGYGTFSDSYSVSVQNVCPEIVVVAPKDNTISLGQGLSLDDFTATIYYNNGDSEHLDSLTEISDGTIQFTNPMYQTGNLNWQAVTLNYHYAYITETGKVTASPSMVVNSAINVICPHQSSVIEHAMEPTTSTYGYTGDKVCAVCGEVLEEGTVIDKEVCTSHTFVTFEPYSDAKHECFCDCGYSELAPHGWGQGVLMTAPTCETDGIRTYTCRDCKAVRTEVVKAPGHVEGEWIIDKEAAPGVEGRKHTICTVCGMTIQEKSIPALPVEHHHNFEQIEQYSDTQHKHVCSCGYVEYEPHTEVIIPGRDATCTTTGLTEGKKCSVCGAVIVAQKVIPVKNHSEVTVIGKAATCTESGLTDGVKCFVCGQILVEQSNIPAPGHKEETIAGKPATCTAAGLTEGKKCFVCGVVLTVQQSIAALGHTEVTIPGKPATCTETGLTYGMKCSVCGEITVPQGTVDMIAHTESGWITDSEAAVGIEGRKHIECTVCRTELRSEIIPALEEVTVPETEAVTEPETQVPATETEAVTEPDTAAPDTEAVNEGCASSVGSLFVFIGFMCLIPFIKKKERMI